MPSASASGFDSTGRKPGLGGDVPSHPTHATGVVGVGDVDDPATVSMYRQSESLHGRPPPWRRGHEVGAGRSTSGVTPEGQGGTENRRASSMTAQPRTPPTACRSATGSRAAEGWEATKLRMAIGPKGRTPFFSADNGSGAWRGRTGRPVPGTPRCVVCPLP